MISMKKSIWFASIAFMRNPNLKMGGIISDQVASFEAEILTQDGSLVDKLVTHKAMGWMRSS